MRTKYALTLIAAATVSFAASAAPADNSAVASAPISSVDSVNALARFDERREGEYVGSLIA